MANLNFNQTVEIMCKYLWKSPCKSSAKFRANLLLTFQNVQIFPFSPTFSTQSHNFFPNLPTSGKKRLFQQFHRPYYNYYI